MFFLFKYMIKENACIKLYAVCNFSSVSHKIIYKPRDQAEKENEAENLKTGKRYAVKKVEELLGVRKIRAIDIVDKHKKLIETTGKKMESNYNICKEHKIEQDTCLKYPYLLMQDSLQQKLSILSKLSTDLNVIAPMAKISLRELERLVQSPAKTTMFGLRLQVFNRIFGLTNEELYALFIARPFLRSIGLSTLENNVNLLLKNGITIEEIKNDWWVVRYSTNAIQQRMDYCHEHNIEKVKTWMVRGQSEIFNNYVQRRSDNRLILGDNTLAEYLSGRLECTTDQAKTITTRLPALKNKSMKRIQQIIDFLYSQGFTPLHICRVPKILLHSVDTTRKRLRELEKQGVKLDSVHILTKSQKQYLQYYEALVKSNKNKIKNKSGT